MDYTGGRNPNAYYSNTNPRLKTIEKTKLVRFFKRIMVSDSFLALIKKKLLKVGSIAFVQLKPWDFRVGDHQSIKTISKR